MSFWTSFEGFFVSAENAYQTITPEIAPAVALLKGAASVVATLDPAAAPVIGAIEAGAASIAAVAPTAIADASTLIANGRQAVTDIGPALTTLLTSLEGLFTATPAPGGAVILTPKTSAATAPAASIAPPAS